MGEEGNGGGKGENWKDGKRVVWTELRRLWEKILNIFYRMESKPTKVSQ